MLAVAIFGSSLSTGQASAAGIPESSAPHLPVTRPAPGTRNVQVVETLLRMATDFKINRQLVAGQSVETTAEERRTQQAARQTMQAWGQKPWKDSRERLDSASADDALYRIKWLDSSIGENRIRSLIVDIKFSTERVSSELAVRRALRDTGLYGGVATLQRAKERASGDGLVWADLCPDANCARWQAMFFPTTEPTVKPFTADRLRRLKKGVNDRSSKLVSNKKTTDTKVRELESLKAIAKLRRDQARAAQNQGGPGSHGRLVKAAGQARSAANQAQTKANEAKTLKAPSQNLRNEIRWTDDFIQKNERESAAYLNWVAGNAADSQPSQSGMRMRRWAKEERNREVRLVKRRGMRVRPEPIFTSSNATPYIRSANGQSDTLTALQDQVNGDDADGSTPIFVTPGRINPLTNAIVTMLEALCNCLEPFTSIPEDVNKINELLGEQRHNPVPTDAESVKQLGEGTYVEMVDAMRDWVRNNPNANADETARSLANIRRGYEDKRDIPDGVTEQGMVATEQYMFVEHNVAAGNQLAEEVNLLADEAEAMNNPPESSTGGSSSGGDSGATSSTGSGSGSSSSSSGSATSGGGSNGLDSSAGSVVPCGTCP